jgi:hypothetical protein
MAILASPSQYCFYEKYSKKFNYTHHTILYEFSIFKKLYNGQTSQGYFFTQFQWECISCHNFKFGAFRHMQTYTKKKFLGWKTFYFLHWWLFEICLCISFQTLIYMKPLLYFKHTRPWCKKKDKIIKLLCIYNGGGRVFFPCF